MKKILLTLLTLCTVFLMTGCKKNITILTDEFSVYIGQNYDLTDYLECEETDLENVSYKIIEGEVNLLKAGTYPVTIEATADNAKVATKEIQIKVNNFEDDEELLTYIQNVIDKKGYTDLTASLSKYGYLDVTGKSFTQDLDNDTTLEIFSEVSSWSATSWAGIAASESPDNPNQVTPLSSSHYSLYITVKVRRNSTVYTNDHYYLPTSFTLTSDSGSCTMKEGQAPSWNRDSETYGSYPNQKHTFKTVMNGIFYDWDKLTEVLNGDNLKLTIVAYKGIYETNPQETIELTFSEEEAAALKTTLLFGHDLFYEYSGK